MNANSKAEAIVKDLERITPYVYEGLYGNFLRSFMESDRSKWSVDLTNYLSRANEDWADVGMEIGALLWERFEKRISC